MQKSVARSAIALALAGILGSAVALKPAQRPEHAAAFLERVALRVERAQMLAPETRDYLAALAARHAAPATDKADEARRQRAAARLATAITQKTAALGQ
jgi:hypothetical protein